MGSEELRLSKPSQRSRIDMGKRSKPSSKPISAHLFEIPAGSDPSGIIKQNLDRDFDPGRIKSDPGGMAVIAEIAARVY